MFTYPHFPQTLLVLEYSGNRKSASPHPSHSPTQNPGTDLQATTPFKWCSGSVLCGCFRFWMEKRFWERYNCSGLSCCSGYRLSGLDTSLFQPTQQAREPPAQFRQRIHWSASGKQCTSQQQPTTRKQRPSGFSGWRRDSGSGITAPV